MQVSSRDFGAFVAHGMCRREATRRGPLDGLTFAVKDLIDVAGTRTGAGNPAWLAQQRPATESASVVKATLAAGAALLGKTVTDELAFSLEGRNVHDGCPINPACPERLSGGSSSGSAVAVAGGLVDFALGTDTGGSVRVPANFVGVFGFRPSHGAVSLNGIVPFAPSYDTVGWFARDAELLAKIGDVLLPQQQRREPIEKLLLARDAFALVDRPVAEELETRAANWPLAGSVDVFHAEEALHFDCYRVLQDAEAWQSLGAWITGNRPPLAADIGRRFAQAATVTASQVATYRTIRATIRGRFEALVPPGMAIVLPTTPCVALPKNAPDDIVSDFYGRALTLTSVAGHCGATQVALPLGRRDGCPIGLSIVGARGSDRALLELATRLAGPGAG